ncbi:methylglyoxal synthase [Pelodictyon luteolum]|nr:methylglyoxal synthase [Pelodictyon luteolum]
MESSKKIALVAHLSKNADLQAWAKYSRDLLERHTLFATGTTVQVSELEFRITVHRLMSGPLGGDRQIGAIIAGEELDFLIFFRDPLELPPHDPDVKVLLRMAVEWNIPAACNPASADFMISSPLMERTFSGWYPTI